MTHWDLPLPPEDHDGCTCPGRCNLHPPHVLTLDDDDRDVS